MGKIIESNRKELVRAIEEERKYLDSLVLKYPPWDNVVIEKAKLIEKLINEYYQ